MLAASAPSAQTYPAEIYRPKYFTAEEWTLLTALVDRLIPTDQEGPGALEAGVTEFIDRQMNEPYGYGAPWYMEGPFRQASPEFGHQLKYTPRELYRAALPAIDQAVQTGHRKAFIQLDDDTKDAVIGELQHGQLAIAIFRHQRPAILAGFRISSALALILLVSAEMIGAERNHLQDLVAWRS
jgi:gluconate 2-dehydrogenase gamma chain